MTPPAALNIFGIYGTNSEELAGNFVEINSPVLKKGGGTPPN